MADLTPEHTSRRTEGDLHPEVREAYRYVDSVVTTADFERPLAWCGWALREAFLAGCTHARAALAEEPAAPAPPADGEVADVVRWLRSRAGIPASADFPAVTAYLTRAAELLQRQALVPVAVSERLPEANTKVLAHYVNDLGKGRTICAIWVPAKTRSDEGGHDDFTEYDEEDDKFYWPEGWYEAIENWDELGYVQVYEGEVDYWQPLPKWPARSLPLPAATDCPRIDSWRPHATPRLHPLHGGDAPVPPAGPLRSIP